MAWSREHRAEGRRWEGEKVGKWGDNIKFGRGNVEGGK